MLSSIVSNFDLLKLHSRSKRLIAKYIFFAIVATAANIGSQDFVIGKYSGTYSIPVSVVVGTSIGLVIKYMLDKRFIFNYRARNAVHDGQTFALYALVGLLTTAIFWAVEFGFHQFFGTKTMRYLGGVIGLSIGYLVKYQLDKRYVFGRRST